jgi:hypothetical protein
MRGITCSGLLSLREERLLVPNKHRAKSDAFVGGSPQAPYFEG